MKQTYAKMEKRLIPSETKVRLTSVNNRPLIPNLNPG